MIFEDLEYIEPKAEEKAALIAKLQKGEYTLSFSSLSAFAQSPSAFIAYKLQETKTTSAMILGEAVHCLVLEPDKFTERYFVAPDVNGATKEGKEAWKKIYEDHVGNSEGDFKMKIQDIIDAIKNACGVTVLSAKIESDAKFRARKLINNRACRHVLDQISETEKAIEYDFMGVKFKGRIDGRGSGTILDLKNMPDATLEGASRAIWGRRLHWQAFGYDKALGGGNRCYILAVDAEGETSAHCFNSRNLWTAEQQIAKYVTEFKRCVTESLFDPFVWDMSQDFWLRTDLNEHGINYL